MATTIIITITALVLLAYFFDITSAWTKVPSVILLLVVGWGIHYASGNLGYRIANLEPLLPILGTIGLILIVLEGSLELELNRKKLPMLIKSSLGALLPLLGFIFGFAGFITYYFNYSFQVSLINAIPLGVISSAIAIPSASNLPKKDLEFVTYESSLSDIFGVIIFNFFTINKVIDGEATFEFTMDITLMIAISFVATVVLSLLIGRIEKHVKFMPILMLVILIYAVAKEFHLPSLVFVMILGLFLGNLDEMAHLRFMHWLNPASLEKEVKRLKEILAEGSFLIRSLFFLLFGFLLNIRDLLNIKTMIWTLGIVAFILFLRTIQLWIMRIPMIPMLTLAPRGLITILLFLSIEPTNNIEIVNNSLVIQVIVVMAIMMTLGLMSYKKPTDSIVSTAEPSPQIPPISPQA